MGWLRSLAITLALGSATWVYAQATGTQPVVSDKSYNLQLRLEPKDIQRGVPKAFTFVLVNISDHDVRVPMPTVNCRDTYNGSLQLLTKFTPLTPQPSGLVKICISDSIKRPPVLDWVKQLRVLHAGEALSESAIKNFDDKDIGTYEFWADYFPPQISTEDQAVLRKAGIDFPHDALTSAHITFVKKP
jgi:hypothetical protein